MAYFLIALLATVLGAATGMGGGVLMKPVLDSLGGYDVGSISMLSSLTVLAMATVTLTSRRKAVRQELRPATALPLCAGAVAGGGLGSALLRLVLGTLDGAIVTVVQNALLAVLILCVFFYMLNRQRVKTLQLNGPLGAVLAGLVLGGLSSFLGIGGGPINVALLTYCFSYSVKTAGLCSLVVILFSQATKLALAPFTGGFAGYDLTVLPVMLAGGVLGGFLGGQLHKRMDEKTAGRLFNAAQLLVLCVCVLNIVRNLQGGAG